MLLALFFLFFTNLPDFLDLPGNTEIGRMPHFHLCCVCHIEKGSYGENIKTTASEDIKYLYGEYCYLLPVDTVTKLGS